MDSSISFCGLSLKNPLIAGSCDYTRSIAQFRRVVDSGVAAISMKSVTDVESLQRASITKFLCLNEEGELWKYGQPIGGFYSRGGAMLSEREWKKIAKEELTIADEKGVLLIGNICASTLESWIHLARVMEETGLKILELNLGNPHYAASQKPMGARIAQSEEILAEVVEAVVQTVSIPIIAKLSPQVSDIVQVARIAQKAGASAVTISHRFQGLIVDIHQQAFLSSALFGYGGSWMLPIALGYVAKVSRALPIAICGSGGVSKWSDVLQLMMAGATTVQVTTALMLKGMDLVPEILNKIERFCITHGFRQWNELIGSALKKEGTLDRIAEDARAGIQDRSFCLECSNKPCMGACYFDAIKLKEDQSVEISAEDCTACGLCIQMCPFPGALAIAKC